MTSQYEAIVLIVSSKLSPFVTEDVLAAIGTTPPVVEHVHFMHSRWQTRENSKICVCTSEPEHGCVEAAGGAGTRLVEYVGEQLSLQQFAGAVLLHELSHAICRGANRFYQLLSIEIRDR